MKVIIFQGQSQFDVMREFSRNIYTEFSAQGHQVILWDLLNRSDKDYLNLLETFRPDFTLGFNPVGIVFKNLYHNEYTSIPHFVFLVDNPYYHLYDRILANPNNKNLFILTIEFADIFKRFGVNKFNTDIKLGGDKSLVQRFPVNNHRQFEVMFAGSYRNYRKYRSDIEESLNNFPSLKKKIHDIFDLIDFTLDDEKSYLPNYVDLLIEQFIGEIGDFESRKYIFTLIEGYYKYSAREKTLKRFIDTGIDITIIGNGWDQVLPKGKNVKLHSAVPFQDYEYLVGQSKIVLNIAPMFFKYHDRVPFTMLAGAVLCTNVLPDLIEEYPEMLNHSLLYNYGTIENTVEDINEILKNEVLRQEIALESQRFAKKHFTWREPVQQIIQIFYREFGTR